ncbi:MAG: hypothetical protein Q8L06_16615, partial [Pseudohongiella sp.]|nr:hypothetical protein [Pseudohongiella sp.]
VIAAIHAEIMGRNLRNRNYSPPSIAVFLPDSEPHNGAKNTNRPWLGPNNHGLMLSAREHQ